MTAVWKRELKAYLKSPLGYVYLFLFLFATGFIFCTINIRNGISDVQYYFQMCCYILIVAIPLLTMRLYPEERRNKTDQILITAPISITKMVLGKFFAAYSMFLISLIPTLFCVGFLMIYGNLEWGVVLGNYVGFLLLGAAYIAIAMLMSCLTESPIIAFMLGLFSLLFFALCDLLLSITDWVVITKLVNIISVSTRFLGFSTGLFDLSAIFYFISLIVIFLFLNIRIIDKRRWS
jgi:ABC-2 type transport system permease protein